MLSKMRKPIESSDLARKLLQAGYPFSIRDGRNKLIAVHKQINANQSVNLMPPLERVYKLCLEGKSDQAAGKESVQTIGAKTTLNGVSVSVESANNSTWDVDLGYTAGGFALTYGVDETDGWTATATSALGGGATFAAGVDSNDSMYAGVSFAF